MQSRKEVQKNLRIQLIFRFPSAHYCIESQVIRLVGHYKPDVVRLDVEMPGLSGLEILQHLSQRAAGLPVIMLTSESKAEVS